MFTELEKKILDATDPKYKYILRTNEGNLYLEVENGDRFFTMNSFRIYNHMFKDVKNGDDPICFRKPILDDIEREYLKAVFKPFHQDIRFVKKVERNECLQEYIEAVMKKRDFMILPNFKAGEMYIGMEPGKEYHLDDLGITYD